MEYVWIQNTNIDLIRKNHWIAMETWCVFFETNYFFSSILSDCVFFEASENGRLFLLVEVKGSKKVWVAVKLSLSNKPSFGRQVFGKLLLMIIYQPNAFMLLKNFNVGIISRLAADISLPSLIVT